MTEPFIIDTDPGVDDALAILMALGSSESEILGITTVGGNISVARATRNALALLKAAGRTDVQVAKGASRPLRGKFNPSEGFHGPGGLSIRLPNPAGHPVNINAVEFIAEQLSNRPGEITIVALGPLTNLARLLQRHPHALVKARRIVIMGGVVGTPGNVTPKAEFNFYNDPAAAHQVLSSGLPITLADLTVCRQIAIDRQQALQLTCKQPRGQLALRIVQHWFLKDPNRQKFEFYDPLALALALNPMIATVRQLSLEIETSSAEDLGETKVLEGVGAVELASKVDQGRFFSMLECLLGWQGL